MPFTIEIRDEDCNVQGDAAVVNLVGVIPPLDDRTSAVLRFVDPWGDTIFNRFQCVALIEEVRERNLSDPDSATLITYANRCTAGVHLYLWFVGD